MIVHDRKGGRRVELYLPFDFMGRRIDAVEFQPCKWDHTLRWQEGRFKRSLDLMIELTGLEENVLRQLVYPDADRVMMQFIEHLPTEIRTDIAEGRVPLPLGDVGDVGPHGPDAAPSAAEDFITREPQAEEGDGFGLKA